MGLNKEGTFKLAFNFKGLLESCEGIEVERDISIWIENGKWVGNVYYDNRIFTIKKLNGQLTIRYEFI